MTRDQLEGLREGLDNAGVGMAASGDGLTIFGNRFEVGSDLGRHTAPDPEDVAAITAVVRNAKVQADYVVVSIHAHEGGANRTIPADFIIEFAHAGSTRERTSWWATDPTCCAVWRSTRESRSSTVSGTSSSRTRHCCDCRPRTTPVRPRSNGRRQRVQLRALRGRPRSFPADPEIWEGAIAMPSFRDGELFELRLLPVTLGFGAPPSIRGRPLPATGELGRKIVQDVIERSARFGTTVEESDGRGTGTDPEIAGTSRAQPCGRRGRR